MNKFLLLLFFPALIALAVNVDIRIGNGRVGSAEFQRFSLSMHSEDWRHWQIQAHAPVISITGSPLRNTRLSMAVQQQNRDVMIRSLRLSSRIADTPLLLKTNAFILRGLSDGSLEMPAGMTLTLRSNGDFLTAVAVMKHQNLRFQAVLPLSVLKPWLKRYGITLTGELRPDIRIEKCRGQYRFSGTLALNNIAYNSADSMQAAEKLSVALQFDLAYEKETLRGKINARFHQGELLITPLYLNFQHEPTTLQAEIRVRPEDIFLDSFRFDENHLHARGSLHWDRRKNRLLRLTADSFSGDADALYQRYAKAFLADTVLSDAELTGSFYLSGVYRTDGLQQIQGILHHINIEDKQSRFQVRNLDTQIGNDNTLSYLHIDGLRWGKLPVGKIHADFFWQPQSGIRLDKPVEIPVSGGAVRITRFVPVSEGYQLAAAIEPPIDLTVLGDKLNTLKFRGKLSGVFPDIRLNREKIQLQQPVRLHIFDGQADIEHLQILRWFSASPSWSFDLNLRALDLAQLTDAFDVGEIQGRIEGQAHHVVFANHDLQAFTLHLATPAEHAGRKLISHEAVAYLSRAGGGSAVAGQFIRILNRFPYDKLGLNARLANGVLTLDGIEPAKDGGYYLLKGQAIPHLDIIGHTRRIDWHELLRRLKTAGNTQGATVESEIGH